MTYFYVAVYYIEYKHLFNLEDEQFFPYFIKQAMNIPYDILWSLRFIWGLAECAISNCTVWLACQAVEQGVVPLISPLLPFLAIYCL